MSRSLNTGVVDAVPPISTSDRVAVGLAVLGLLVSMGGTALAIADEWGDRLPTGEGLGRSILFVMPAMILSIMAARSIAHPGARRTAIRLALACVAVPFLIAVAMMVG
jgi:hypothetical protein